MSIPTHLKYTAEHEWVRFDGGVAVVGITAYAADALGDVVYVELPDVGDAITEGGACGEIESTKSVSDLLAPVDGEVLEANAQVVADPSVINSDPFGDGWLIKVRPAGEATLMDADEYRALVGSGS